MHKSNIISQIKKREANPRVHVRLNESSAEKLAKLMASYNLKKVEAVQIGINLLYQELRKKNKV